MIIPLPLLLLAAQALATPVPINGVAPNSQPPRKDADGVSNFFMLSDGAPFPNSGPKYSILEYANSYYANLTKPGDSATGERTYSYKIGNYVDTRLTYKLLLQQCQNEPPVVVSTDDTIACNTASCSQEVTLRQVSTKSHHYGFELSTKVSAGVPGVASVEITASTSQDWTNTEETSIETKTTFTMTEGQECTPAVIQFYSNCTSTIVIQDFYWYNLQKNARVDLDPCSMSRDQIIKELAMLFILGAHWKDDQINAYVDWIRSTCDSKGTKGVVRMGLNNPGEKPVLHRVKGCL